jgi:hypothetical protein
MKAETGHPFPDSYPALMAIAAAKAFEVQAGDNANSRMGAGVSFTESRYSVSLPEPQDGR